MTVYNITIHITSTSVDSSSNVHKESLGCLYFCTESDLHVNYPSSLQNTVLCTPTLEINSRDIQIFTAKVLIFYYTYAFKRLLHNTGN